MLLFNRRNILAAAAVIFALGGCGFTPIYGTDTAASDLHGQMEITTGKGREFFEMRERMVERFGFASTPRYNLIFTYNVVSTGLAVTKTAEVTRYNLVGTSDFKVIDRASNAVLFNGNVQAATAYNATSETYPTRVAKQDARTRLAIALADQIVIRIASTASQWAK